MLLAGGKLGKLSWVHKNGQLHLSPNSGHPEAALAAILDCRFGGPHNYFGQEVWKPWIGEHTRPLTTADMERAVRINHRAEILMVALVVAFNALFLLH